MDMTNMQRTATAFFGAVLFTVLSLAVAVSPAINPPVVTASQTAQVQLDGSHA